ncbi:altronate dehydratase family protein, partial [Paenibacillus sepulcri]|nr:altronate dehydratase family protein [Paenibacillus sepulcri]
MSDYIKLSPSDHVMIALRDLQPGETVQAAESGGAAVTVLDPVPKGHKLLVKPVSQGDDVLKFGYSIGKAKEAIEAGHWVHTHNLETGLRGKLEYVYSPAATAAASENEPPAPGELTFQGYVRDNGEVGIRNEIWILNTVGCINKTCEVLAKMAS